MYVCFALIPWDSLGSVDDKVKMMVACFVISGLQDRHPYQPLSSVFHVELCPELRIWSSRGP